MTLQELKAQAYDLIVQLETLQKRLQETNQEIVKLSQEENPLQSVN